MNYIHLMKHAAVFILGLFLTLTGGLRASAAPESGTVTAPELLGPLSVNIPPDLEYRVDESDMATVLLRIDKTGRVVDWVPLELPHYGLAGVLGSSLEEARFRPATLDGKAVSADLTAEINIGQGGRVGVQSVSVVEWVHTRMDYMGINPERLYLSSTEDLDTPLRLIERGKAKSVQSESGEILTGKVWVEFYVDQNGHPRLISPEDSGRPALEQAALLAVQEFRFAGPKSHGVPTVVRARVLVVFS